MSRRSRFDAARADASRLIAEARGLLDQHDQLVAEAGRLKQHAGFESQALARIDEARKLHKEASRLLAKADGSIAALSAMSKEK